MWKFQDFAITPILREINFVDSKSAKNTVFAISGAMNFVRVVNFRLQKVHKNPMLESLNVLIWLILHLKYLQN